MAPTFCPWPTYIFSHLVKHSLGVSEKGFADVIRVLHQLTLRWRGYLVGLTQSHEPLIWAWESVMGGQRDWKHDRDLRWQRLSVAAFEDGGGHMARKIGG